MSIFSGLSLESLSTAIELAGRSPEALGALAVVGIVVVLAIGFAGGMIAHGVGGFYAHIEEEDELARLEEERLEEEKARKAQQEGKPEEERSQEAPNQGRLCEGRPEEERLQEEQAAQPRPAEERGEWDP